MHSLIVLIRLYTNSFLRSAGSALGLRQFDVPCLTRHRGNRCFTIPHLQLWADVVATDVDDFRRQWCLTRWFPHGRINTVPTLYLSQASFFPGPPSVFWEQNSQQPLTPFPPQVTYSFIVYMFFNLLFYFMGSPLFDLQVFLSNYVIYIYIYKYIKCCHQTIFIQIL